MRAVIAHKEIGGTEHDAYIVGEANNRVVIRSTAKSGFGLTSSDSPAQYLKRLAEYNATFPLLQIRVVGVSIGANGVPVIWTAQSFVPGQFFKNHDLLFKALADKGWEKVAGEAFRFRHTETGAVIDDAHFRNVLHIGDKLYPIDVIVKEMPKAGSDTIKFSRSGGNAGQSAQPGNSASWDAPEHSTIDRVIYTLQDKHVDLKRVSEALFLSGRPKGFNRKSEAQMAVERADRFISASVSPVRAKPVS